LLFLLAREVAPPPPTAAGSFAKASVESVFIFSPKSDENWKKKVNFLHFSIRHTLSLSLFQTSVIKKNGGRQREKNPPAQRQTRFFPPQIRLRLFSVPFHRPRGVASIASDLDVPHFVLVVGVSVLLPEFTETRETDVRFAHERTSGRRSGFESTRVDAVLLRLRVRDVRELMVDGAGER